MVFRYLTAGGGDRNYDADALAWRSAVVAAGGTVTSQRMLLVDALITDLKACNAWAKTDDYALWAAENAVAGLVTLKQRITQTAINGPTFTANRGFQGNAIDQWVNTGWNYSVGTSYTKDNARYGFWQETGPPTNGTHSMGTNNLYASFLIGTTNASFGINGTTSAGAYDVFAHGGKTGMFTAQRTASNVTAGYKNNVSMVTGSRVSFAPENFNVGALAATTSGVPTVGGFSDGRLAMLFYGRDLSPTEATGEYNAWRAFMTAIGVA